MDDVTVERVLRCAELIPPGQVASYGQIGAIVGLGARQVGAVMAHWGSSVPWWRVTSHAGDLPNPLLQRALPRWEGEGIELKPNGRGCRIARHRADSARLAAAWERAVADLPE